MIIVAGFTRTSVDKRDNAVSAFEELVAKARNQKGCMDFAISADPLDRSRINLFKLWSDQDALEAWRTIARPPDIEAADTSVDVYEVHEP